jgi:hypothetical protein
MTATPHPHPKDLPPLYFSLSPVIINKDTDQNRFPILKMRKNRVSSIPAQLATAQGEKLRHCQ